MVLTYVMREIGFLGEFLKTKLCHSTLITWESEMTGDIYDVWNTFNSLEQNSSFCYARHKRVFDFFAYRLDYLLI